MFATEHVPRGTITWVLDPLDRLLTPAEERMLPAALGPVLTKYGYVDGAGVRVVCWGPREVHEPQLPSPPRSRRGCRSSLRFATWPPGDELTSDYGGLNIEEPFACLCGEPSCREEIRPDDVTRLAQGWDLTLRQVVSRVVAVPQPLWPLVRDQGSLLAASRDPLSLPSSLANYHAPAMQERVA